jgi:hypothetical protein
MQLKFFFHIYMFFGEEECIRDDSHGHVFLLVVGSSSPSRTRTPPTLISWPPWLTPPPLATACSVSCERFLFFPTLAVTMHRLLVGQLILTHGYSTLHVLHVLYALHGGERCSYMAALLESFLEIAKSLHQRHLT